MSMYDKLFEKFETSGILIEEKQREKIKSRLDKVLNYVPRESFDKIPQTMLDTFKAKSDQNYDFKVDINKSFEEQELLDETKAIFANIFRDYWATPYQKERIKAKEKHDRQKIEEEKAEKYNPDDLFKKKKIETEEDSEKTEKISNLPIEVKKEKLFEKIINFFKKILNNV